MKRALELRTEAGKLVKQARDLMAKAQEEKRDLTQEESAAFDKMHDDAEGMIKQAERLERQERADMGFDEEGRQIRDNGHQEEGTPEGRARVINARRASADYADAFRSYLAGGYEAPQRRASLQVDLDIGGGFIAASERLISGILADAMSQVSVGALVNRIPCDFAEELGQPTLTSTLSEFTYAGELTEAEVDEGIAFGKRSLKPSPLKRKIIKISKRLLESPRMDAEAVVRGEVSKALAYTIERKICQGSGANEPLGLFTANNDGIGTARDVVTGSATNWTADGLIDVQATLKDFYQSRARWLMHRDALPKIRKLKDGNGAYIWAPGLQTGQPNMILGKPYSTSDFCPNTWTNGLYVAIYGDFSYYNFAEAMSMQVQRLVEKYAEFGQIGLLIDGMANDGMPWVAEAFVRAKLGV